MTELRKATLTVLDGAEKGTAVTVQFNPASLHLQMTNSVDGAKSRGRQAQQYNGTSSTQLNVDLEFDTADDGTNNDPVDVRSRTNEVRRFVLPGGSESKQAPPRVKFEWGTFALSGVMSSLNEELGFFSRNGAPLRSKLSIQIKEQDPKFAALTSGPGANADNAPPASGDGNAASNGPGTAGGGPVDKATAALAGETPADFLARNGLAPEAWRALGSVLNALGDGLELEAGLSIGFDASLSVGLGIGVSAGLHVGLAASVEASLGLRAGGGGSGGAGLQQGFSLAAAGGVTAATETARATQADGAAEAARASFGAAAALTGIAAPVAMPASAGRAPLSAGRSARTQPVSPSAAAPAPPRADRRSLSYGRGVPLRDRVSVPGAEPEGYVVLGRSGAIEPGGQGSAALAPWERLAPSRSRTAADREQGARRPACGCRSCATPGGGCGRSCGGRGRAGGCGGGCR